MERTITRLRIVGDGGEVEVYLDQKPAFRVDALSAVRLQVGQTLNPDHCATFKAGDTLRRVRNKALAYLARRARSTREMDRYLQGKGYDGSVRQQVLQRLQEERYLDDRAFARMWVEHRLRTSPRGHRALAYELKQKGIERTLIANVLADISETEPALDAARSRMGHWRALDERTLEIKLSRFLAGRGFSPETIHQTRSDILAEHRDLATRTR